MSTFDELLAPVSDARPTGDYLRYDPLYDKVKEARREDLDVPQGDWQTALKTADWPLVVKLTSEALARRSKDLQLAAWLAEALLKRDGLAGLHQGLQLLDGLLAQYWDDLYPELEDGDAELRAAPLEWVGQYLVSAVRQVPLNQEGHHLLDYQGLRGIPSEQEAASSYEKRDARQQAVNEGRVLPEAFEKAFAATPKSWYQALCAEIEGCLEAVEALEATCDERFGGDAPSFVKLREALREVQPMANALLARKREAEPDPVTAPSPTEADAALAAGLPAHDGPGRGAETAGAAPLPASAAGTATVPALAIAALPRALDEASARLAAVAQFLRAQNPADPAPFLLLRGYRWGELRRAAPEVDATLLEAPPTELRARLKALLLEERWAELLAAGEELMAAPYGRGWLDLQRYAVSACEALAGEFVPLGAALRSALRSLLADLPQLPALTLMDDTPVANAETQQWLRAQGLLGAHEPVAAPLEPPPPRAGRRDVLERAREQARAGQPQAAVALLMREAAQETSARERFLRRLQAAELLVGAAQEAVAMPLLQELVQQIETHQLEKWEAAETIAQPLGLLYRCLKQQEGSYSEVQALFLRVCRLDPLLAMRLQTENGGNG